jgi:hypothetical protein
MTETLVQNAVPSPRDTGAAWPTEDRRAWPRSPLMRLARLRCGRFPGKTFTIRLLDASAGGIGFSSPVPLEVGQTFDILLEDSAGLQRLSLRAVYCEFIDDEAYRIGARLPPHGPPA